MIPPDPAVEPGDVELPFLRQPVPGREHRNGWLLIGDARERLLDIPDESVQCVVTSPPYYGLRDYDTGEWEGGDPACDHRKSELRRGVNLAQSAASTRGGAKKIAETGWISYSGECGKCGAQRIDQQIGLEDTVTEYVAALVDVFREVRRVLRPDGVVWLNLGDSYASRAAGNGEGATASSGLTNPERQERTRVQHGRRSNPTDGLKDKDLMGVPWRVAFALQDDGWWLRSDVVWAKPNPVPESVRDRPSRAHEYVFLLTKRARYFYDADAVRERGESGPSDQAKVREEREREPGQKHHAGDPKTINGSGGQLARRAAVGDGTTRNRRTVWTLPTQPYKGAHFAVFPPGLAEPCVLAGSSPMACSVCGGPYVRVTKRTTSFESHSSLAGRTTDDINGTGKYADSDCGVNGARGSVRAGPVVDVETVGWRPSCVCGAPKTLKLKPDDMEVIESPAGDGGTEDPSLTVGRAGFARERGEDAGITTMTRYEQRQYARQLAELAKTGPRTYEVMRQQAGPEAFQHYRRKDRTGARAIPAELLDGWLAEEWLSRVSVPVWEPPATTECVVLDPFAGSGTVGVVCGWHGRRFIGIELNAASARLAFDRIARDGRPARRPVVVVEVPVDQLSLLA